MKKLSSVNIQGGLTVDQATTLSGTINIGGIGVGAYTSVLVRNGSNQLLHRSYADFVVDITNSINLSGYVPYTGATANLNLGERTLLSRDIIVNHSNGSGIAASITKAGTGEALTVVKASGSGNAASITGGITLISELNLTTDLADSHIASASVWNAKIGGSGTTNFLSKFTGGSTLGNSLVFDNGTNVGIGTTTPSQTLTISQSTGSTPYGGVVALIENTSSIGEAAISIRNQSFYAAFEIFGSAFNITGIRNTALFTTQNGITNLGFATLGAANISFRTNSTGASNERLTIQGSSGNVLINTTTDAGFKLDVNGTARVSGNLTVDTNTLFVDAANDRVGIGTTNPSAKLHVSGGDALIRDAFIGLIPAYGGNYTSFSHVSRSAVNKYSILSGNVGDTYVNSSNGNSIYFRHENIDNAIITAAGNVGIGTTAPTQKLYVSATVEDYVAVIENLGTGTAKNGLWIKTDSSFTNATVLKVTGTTSDSETLQVNPGQVRIGPGSIGQFDGTLFLTSSAATVANFVANNSSALFISGSGNVGIGTTSPSQKLHVVGTVLATQLSITDGSTTGLIKYAGLNATASSMDLVMPNSGSIRFGAVNFDGPAFQGFHGTRAGLAGQMYFDYGSQQRAVASRGVFFRNASSTSPITVMKLTETSNVLIGTTTDNGLAKLQVNGGITASFPNTTTSNIIYYNTGTKVMSYGPLPSAGTVTSITAGTGLTGGTITTSGTISLADTAVTAGAYTNADITIDAQGRIIEAANGAGAPSGFTGTFTVPTNPPGQQTLDIVNGIIVNVF